MRPADAVHDLLNTWLVARKPEDVIPYFAHQSFACAELEAGEKLDRGMAPFRLLMALQQANQRFGTVSQLGDILTAVSPHPRARTKLVQHPYQDQFALYEVREDAAEQFSCVNRLDVSRTSPKATASKSFGKYYGAVFRIGKKDGADATTLATLWMRESNGFWRLISYDIDPVWDEYRVPNTATTTPPPAPTRYTTAPADLIGAATKFLMSWLVKQDLDEASHYLSAKCADCLKLNRASGQPGPKAAADTRLYEHRSGLRGPNPRRTAEFQTLRRREKLREVLRHGLQVGKGRRGFRRALGYMGSGRVGMETNVVHRAHPLKPDSTTAVTMRNRRRQPGAARRFIASVVASTTSTVPA